MCRLRLSRQRGHPSRLRQPRPRRSRLNLGRPPSLSPPPPSGCVTLAAVADPATRVRSDPLQAIVACSDPLTSRGDSAESAPQPAGEAPQAGLGAGVAKTRARGHIDRDSEVTGKSWRPACRPPEFLTRSFRHKLVQGAGQWRAGLPSVLESLHSIVFQVCQAAHAGDIWPVGCMQVTYGPLAACR